MYKIKFVLPYIVIMVILFYPFFEKEVTISLPIIENRPFAGVVNGQFVGSHVSCQYLLSRKKMDSETKFEVSYCIIGYITGDATAKVKK